jgi:hypothetical protein
MTPIISGGHIRWKLFATKLRMTWSDNWGPATKIVMLFYELCLWHHCGARRHDDGGDDGVNPVLLDQRRHARLVSGYGWPGAEGYDTSKRVPPLLKSDSQLV